MHELWQGLCGQHGTPFSRLRHSLELATGLLAAAIRMVQHPDDRLATLHRHVQGLLDQPTGQVIGHGPTHDFAGKQIQNGSRILSAFGRPNVSDIAQPLLDGLELLR